MVVGTTGLHGSARGRITILAAVLGLVVGYLAASIGDGPTALGALFGLIGAAFACPVVSDVVAGASRRGGNAALALLIIVAALIVALIAIFLKVVALLAIAAMIWLFFSRRRRARRKYEGLRVLR